MPDVLRVSYGLFSQAIINLLLFRSSTTNIFELIHSRTNGSLSIRTHHSHTQPDEDDELRITVLAKIYREPTRLEIFVHDVVAEQPPGEDSELYGTSTPVALGQLLLFSPGVQSVKVAMVLSGASHAASKPFVPHAFKKNTLQSPARKENGESRSSQQNYEYPTDEDSDEKAGDVLSRSVASTAAPAREDPPASPVEEPTVETPLHEDAETESEAEEEDQPTKHAEEAQQPAAFVPPAPNMRREKFQSPQQDPPAEVEESQDGITSRSFLTHVATPTKQKRYGKKHGRVVPLSRKSSSLAPEIPNSDISEVPRTSFMDTPKAAVEVAARSVKKLSFSARNDEDDFTPAADIEHDFEEEGINEAEAVLSTLDDEEDINTNEEEVELQPSPEATSTITKKKRKSDLPSEDEDDDEEEDARPTKLPRRSKTRSPQVVIPRPRTSKLKTPARPSASTKKPSTQPRNGVKTPASTPRTAKTPTPAPASSSTPSSGKMPSKVLFSGSKLTLTEKKWLGRQVTVVEEVPGRRANFVCVVRNKDLPTTLKVLRSLIAGKPVVTDQWVLDSKAEGELLDPLDYLHPDLQSSSIMPNDRRQVWKGKTLFFTTSAAASYGVDWIGVQITAMESGARAVEYGNANKGGELLHDKASTILIGIDPEEDRDAKVLIEEYGRDVFDKALFAQGIVRADVDLGSEEFLLGVEE